MKKILTRSLSFLLVAMMLLSSFSAFSFAADGDTAPVFSVEKVSETPTELKLKLSIKEGAVACFDLKLTAADLTCTKISLTSDYNTTASEIKDNEGQITDCSNKANGMIGVASTVLLEAPLDIAVYTFTKTEPDGINGSDISLVIESCAVLDDNVEAVSITDSVQVSIDVPATHVHTGTWTVITAPSCDKDGLEGLICDECGQNAGTRPIAKTEHESTHKDTQAATCTEDGYENTVCDKCGTVVSTVVIPKTGHEKTHKETQAASCTEDGYENTVCDKCGTVVSTVVIPKTGHEKTHKESQAATCTEDGYENTVCDKCGTVVSTVVIPKTGHEKTHKETQAATCTKDGFEKTICDKCGEVISNVVIPKKGHGHLTADIKNATCTEDGYAKYICDDCHQVVKENVIPKTGHKYVNEVKEPTCYEDGYVRITCSACGHIFSSIVTAKNEHQWTSWVVEEPATYRSTGLKARSCRLCGERQEETIPMEKVPVKDITMSLKSLTMNYKQTSRLYVNVSPEEAAFSADIIWKSSNSKICSVDENGVITATGRGTATITASTSDGKFSDTCTVKVEYTFIQKIIVYLLFGWIWY